MWLVPIVYLVVSGVEALLAGSVVGLMLVLSFLLVLILPVDKACGQFRSCLQLGTFSHVNMDSFSLGFDQCPGTYTLFFFDPRWYLI